MHVIVHVHIPLYLTYKPSADEVRLTHYVIILMCLPTGLNGRTFTVMELSYTKSNTYCDDLNASYYSHVYMKVNRI